MPHRSMKNANDIENSPLAVDGQFSFKNGDSSTESTARERVRKRTSAKKGFLVEIHSNRLLYLFIDTSFVLDGNNTIGYA